MAERVQIHPVRLWLESLFPSLALRRAEQEFQASQRGYQQSLRRKATESRVQRQQERTANRDFWRQ